MHDSIPGSSAWRGSQLANERDWIHEFSSHEVQEIDEALAFAKARGGTLSELARKISRYLASPSESRSPANSWKTVREFISCAASELKGARRASCVFFTGRLDFTSGPRSHKARMATFSVTSAMWASTFTRPKGEDTSQING